MISLRGKRALVTGGSRGIGAATAILLAECGADVGIGYKSRTDAAAQGCDHGPTLPTLARSRPTA